MTDVPAARPAWPTVAAQTARRTVDLKIVIAVLIGLVSVTSAVVTWRSAQLNEYATDKDRQAIAETVRVQQDEANNEIVVQDSRTRMAAHAAAIASADALDEQAERFAAAGNDDAARVAADEAEEQRAVAARALQGGPTNLLVDDYIELDEETGRPTLDVGRLRDDLRAQASTQSRVNPSQTVREANRLRDESQHFDGWLVPLIAAVVILTFAQISRRRPVRLALAGLGTAVWIVAAVSAFGGP